MAVKPPASPKGLVLLVEDDPAVRHALTFSLGLEGYDVESFIDGDALLRRTAPSPPVCLVVDENLPGLAGHDLIAAARRRWSNLPAILITTGPSPLVQDAMRSMRVQIIEKPLLDGELATGIAGALGESA